MLGNDDHDEEEYDGSGWVTLPCRLHLVKTRPDIDLEEVDTLRHDNNSGWKHFYFKSLHTLPFINAPNLANEKMTNEKAILTRNKLCDRLTLLPHYLKWYHEETLQKKAHQIHLSSEIFLLTWRHLPGESVRRPRPTGWPRCQVPEYLKVLQSSTWIPESISAMSLKEHLKWMCEWPEENKQTHKHKKAIEFHLCMRNFVGSYIDILKPAVVRISQGTPTLLYSVQKLS